MVWDVASGRVRDDIGTAGGRDEAYLMECESGAERNAVPWQNFDIFLAEIDEKSDIFVKTSQRCGQKVFNCVC